MSWYYFSSIKNGFISFFSSSETYQYHHPFRCHATGIIFLAYFFFTCLALFKSIMPSYESNMINSFWIILIKIIIIKVNIIKVYIIKTYIISKKCDNIRICTMKKCATIRKYRIISCLNILFVINKLRINFNVKR